MYTPPAFFRAAFLRFVNLFRKQKLDRELSAELESHLELHIEDNLRAGMSATEARRQALLRLGGAQQTKEAIRDAALFATVDSLVQDTRFTIRQIRKEPRFFAIALLTLALGIAATTIVFGVYYDALFAAFPYKNFDRAVALRIEGVSNSGGWKGRDFFSPSELDAFRRQSTVLEDIVASENHSVLFDNGRIARVIRAATVTPNFFDFYGIPALSGRVFTSRDTTPRTNEVLGNELSVLANRIRRQRGNSQQNAPHRWNSTHADRHYAAPLPSRRSRSMVLL